MADATANGTDGSTTPVGRNANGQFVKGHRSRGGRPKGARNRLTEKFLGDLQKVWRKKGLKALDRLADEDPATLARVVSQVLPKELLVQAHMDVSVERRLFRAAENYVEAFRLARQFIGADEVPPMIEAPAVEEIENAD